MCRPWATLTLAPSTLRDLAAHGIPRLAHWGRGVDLERFHPRHRDERLRAELAPGGEVIAGYVGRLAADKRVHLLAGPADLPGIRPVIVGDGPAAGALRRLLPGAVFCGLRTGPELSRLMASFDLFVHPGRNETFGQAIQEALAAGVPVVAPAAGGRLDLVRHGHNGLLHDPDSACGLLTDVARLAASPETRRRMARAARASVLGRTWGEVCDQLITTHYQSAGLHRADLTVSSQAPPGSR